jgi:hypothetical protein
VSSAPLEDLIDLAYRDLEASRVHLLEPGEQRTVAEGSLRCDLPGGRVLYVECDVSEHERAALQRRLEMIVDSMRESLSATAGSMRPSRPPPKRSLKDELAALARRAGATDALVIDARSPVIWGSASGLHEELDEEDEDGIPAAIAGQEPVNDTESQPEQTAAAPREAAVALAAEGPPDALDRALGELLAMPEMETLHKGGHLHHVVSEPGFGYVARSFAAIYVLVLLFEEPIDELRAKRAVSHALPTVEQLVLSLPPMDPDPSVGGQMAVRRRRR